MPLIGCHSVNIYPVSKLSKLNHAYSTTSRTSFGVTEHNTYKEYVFQLDLNVKSAFQADMSETVLPLRPLLAWTHYTCSLQ